MTVPAYIDEHSVSVDAGRSAVWDVLRPYAAGFGLPTGGLAGRAARLFWAADPASGFAIVDERPGEEIVLEGRHRFSRYRLAFLLADAPSGGTVLTARSYGDFPGIAGRAYRAAVIGTRAHVVMVRRTLGSVRRKAEAG